MEIRDLADCPEHLPVLAEWHHSEWGRIVPGGTLEWFRERLRTHLNHDTLPLALVALEGDAPIGSASLRAADMPSRPELTPWLGGMYVRDDLRGRGIGEALVRAAEQRAREMGFGEMFLFATDREGFYRRLGWTVLGPAEHFGEQCVLMRTEL
ncbi:MAG TPA: GNAT family N-acetyltransferase [Longimicrobiaceae bacterium]|nr:GNAT family N-acetyltransferase [Longimicrobiaceae bacterium]